MNKNSITENEANQTHLPEQINEALHNLVADSMDEQLVWLFKDGFDTAVKVKNILYCDSHSSPKEQTEIIFLDEEDGAIKSILSSYGIGKWEEMLSRFKFCRIHRKHLVNYKLLTKFSRLENMVTLKIANKNFPVSRKGKEKLHTLMHR